MRCTKTSAVWLQATEGNWGMKWAAEKEQGESKNRGGWKTQRSTTKALQAKIDSRASGCRLMSRECLYCMLKNLRAHDTMARLQEQAVDGLWQMILHYRRRRTDVKTNLVTGGSVFFIPFLEVGQTHPVYYFRSFAEVKTNSPPSFNKMIMQRLLQLLFICTAALTGGEVRPT